MSRQKVLAQYIRAHEDLTIEQIQFIKDALLFYEALYGKDFDEDYQLEVECAIEVYINYLNNEQKYKKESL